MVRKKKRKSKGWDVSPHNMELAQRFISLLRFDGQEYFTSDDFRIKYGLGEYVQGGYGNDTNLKHALGGIFAAMIKHGLAEPTGEWVPSQIPENNKRRIQVYRRVKVPEEMLPDGN